ncbi:MAG: polyphosphate kinase 2 family protein [Myxococcales bacterium]|nr:polyphosphate kinase 2 family protein [Myxococcales bacterium]
MARHRPQSYARVVDGRGRFRLSQLDPAETFGLDKDQGKSHIQAIDDEFRELADLLAYAGSHSLLVVIQGRDAAGKDGCVRHLLSVSNVQTVRVTAFKVPSAEELSHDFLWRIHQHAPRKGDLAIFNRSHYEDVLATRVHNLVPRAVWKRRYAHINAFEELLTDAQTILVKFFLHVSKDEQEKRLLERERDPRKFWKLNPSDWVERDLWDEATAAYEDALNLCSSKERPWHVIPADHKWFRNVAVLDTLVKVLRPYRKQWMAELEAIGKKAKQEITRAREASQAKGTTKAREG